ncbi:MAG: signal peptidase I [Aquificae bacterium]|nr:signal peptidase I [Aquificota bacterium]
MNLAEHLKGLLLFLLFLVVLRLFFVDAYNIPSRSMEPTLLQGDFILSNKLVYRFSDPRRGDVIVFVYPYQARFGNPLVKVTFVKRVVAVGGDTVEFKNGFLVLNGRPLRYEKVKEATEVVRVYERVLTADGRIVRRPVERKVEVVYYYEYLPSTVEGRVVKHLVRYWKRPAPEALSGRYGVLADALPEGACLERSEVFPSVCSKVRVPEGYYLVLGDNRDESEDGRYWGLLAREFVLSRPFVVYFSGEVPPLTPEETDLLSGVRQLFRALLHPRWERIGKPLIY